MKTAIDLPLRTMTNSQLERAADEILKADRQESSEHGILTESQLRDRRRKEVYSATGTVENFTQGVFSRKLGVLGA